MKKASARLLLLIIISGSCGQNPKKKIDSIKEASNSKKDLNYNTNIMRKLPSTDDPIVMRTDFSNDFEWQTIYNEIVTPNPKFGFLPNVVFVNDTTVHDYTEEQLLCDSSLEYNHAFIFIVDKFTITNPEHPVLCIGLKHNRGLKLRTIPSEMWAIENNLSISNMDFEEFVGAVDKDGIFRGFKE